MPQTHNSIPTEAAEQMMLFRWVETQKESLPELGLLFHIPNGGSRHPGEAARLKLQGVRAGVPDLCLPVPRMGYHGMYIELKRQRGGRVSAEQTEWIEALVRQKYCVAVCHGWEEARQQILGYLLPEKAKRLDERCKV